MKSILSFLTLAIFIALSSCKTTSSSTVTADIKGPTVIQKPVIADLDVQQKRITGTATGKRSISEEELRQMAIADAVKKSNSDVLVEPRFDVVTNGREVTVTVSGYPATYKNFRPMEAQDSIFVSPEGLNTSSVERKEARKDGRTKRIIGWTAGGVVAGIGLFLLSFLFY